MCSKDPSSVATDALGSLIAQVTLLARLGRVPQLDHRDAELDVSVGLCKLIREITTLAATSGYEMVFRPWARTVSMSSSRLSGVSAPL